MAVIDKIETRSKKAAVILDSPEKTTLKLRSGKKSLSEPRATQENNSIEINLSEKDWSTFTNALNSRRTTPKLNQAFKKLKKQCN